MKVFSIDGYFADDKESPFYGWLVAEYDSTPDGYSDEQIFFYGLSEGDIATAIGSGEPVDDFVITRYEVVERVLA